MIEQLSHLEIKGRGTKKGLLHKSQRTTQRWNRHPVEFNRTDGLVVDVVVVVAPSDVLEE